MLAILFRSQSTAVGKRADWFWGNGLALELLPRRVGLRTGGGEGRVRDLVMWKAGVQGRFFLPLCLSLSLFFYEGYGYFSSFDSLARPPLSI